jgi:nicotinamide-nucleotide amidase
MKRAQKTRPASSVRNNATAKPKPGISVTAKSTAAKSAVRKSAKNSTNTSIRSNQGQPRIAKILAIGDELVLGRTVDSNSAHLARWAVDHGLRVAGAQSVGDSEAAIVAALKNAAKSADLILVSGGLGPTDDDRTRSALAKAAGAPLVDSPAAWKAIQAWFHRNRPDLAVPAINRRQAQAPQGAILLDNDRGTAPGLLMRLGRAWVACFPGVPHEMFAMVAGLGRRLPRLLPGLAVPTIGELYITGIGESAAQEKIGDLLTEHDPLVGITVSELGHIVLRAVGKKAQVDARIAKLREILAEWALPGPGIAPSLFAALAAVDATIATAESCTCGHLAAAIGAIPGASRIFREGLVAYHADTKINRLGVGADVIATHGVVSEAVVRAMAEGIRARSGATIGVATTGVAGPAGGTAESPVGTVWFAVSTAHGTRARTVRIGGDRGRIQRRGAGYALELAWNTWKSEEAARAAAALTTSPAVSDIGA